MAGIDESGGLRRCHEAIKTDARRFGSVHNNSHDWRIEQRQAVARQFGMAFRREGGSHPVCSHKVVMFGVNAVVQRSAGTPLHRAAQYSGVIAGIVEWVSLRYDWKFSLDIRGS